MTSVSNSRSTLERWLALVVRYWSFNMTLIHNRGSNWPGFGYSEREKAELAAMAGEVPRTEFYVWMFVFVVFFLAILIAVVLAGFSCLTYAIGGEQNMAKTPEALFFMMMALNLLVALSIGFPAAMLPSAAVAGRLFHVADSSLPDRLTTAHYFRKLWFQITRMASMMLLVLIPLWLFAPSDSRFWILTKLVLPFVSVAVSALTSAYYLSARVAPSGRKTEGG